MKKLLSVVLASILALSLVGCGGSDDKITIAIPNDTTNEARALLLLEDKGYIKVKDDAGITCNCAVVNGGTVVNTVPGKCKFSVNFRYVSKEDAEYIRSKAERRKNKKKSNFF